MGSFRFGVMGDWRDRYRARNIAKQLTIYATGAPLRFSDRSVIEQILRQTQPTRYGLRSLIHAVVQSPLFREK